MNKRFYFLSGMSRSGNTLLSSILNQNPKIHSSALSPVIEYIHKVHSASLDCENAQRPSTKVGTVNVLKNIINSYYQNIEKEIIFDREKSWINIENIKLAKLYIDKDPKIVFTVRPVLEVLSSMILINEKSKIIETNMKNLNWQYKHNLSLNDNKCDFLMRPWGGLDYTISSFSKLKKDKNLSSIHVVEYKSLVENPQETMNSIYNFLNIDSYSHDFKNIVKIEEDNDDFLGLPKSLHDVKKEIVGSTINYKDVLSDYAINKYSNMDFWKE